MKAILTLLLVTTTTIALSQNIRLSADSVKASLCKKWETDYALMGNTKIGRDPGASQMYYEFSKNGTYVMTGDDPGDITKGTWNYDAKGKRIILKENGRDTIEIVALNNREMIMKAPRGKNDPTGMDIKVVFRPRTSQPKPSTKKTVSSSSPVRMKNLSMKDPDSKTVYVGKENIIEIEGADGKLFFTVTGAGSILKKLSETKVAVIPSGAGSLSISVIQNGKMLVSENFKAVVADSPGL